MPIVNRQISITTLFGLTTFAALLSYVYALLGSDVWFYLVPILVVIVGTSTGVIFRRPYSSAAASVIGFTTYVFSIPLINALDFNYGSTITQSTGFSIYKGLFDLWANKDHWIHIVLFFWYALCVLAPIISVIGWFFVCFVFLFLAVRLDRIRIASKKFLVLKQTG